MMRRVWQVLGLTVALALVLVVGASAAVQEDGGGTDLWQDPGSVRFKFAHEPNDTDWDDGLYVNDWDGSGDDEWDTLRLYGRCTRDAAFPYTEFDGPFNLKSPEAPEKDFLVFNPIFLDHWDNPLYKQIKAGAADANQKVHMRMWYVPKLEEPVGDTFPEVTNKVSNWEQNGYGDVVFEYTYILLDDATNNPTYGQATKTRLVFPMAGQAPNNNKVGLEGYDVNYDGQDEILSVDNIALPADLPADAAHTTMGEIWVSPKVVGTEGMRLNPGDYIDFLDYRVELQNISTDERKAEIAIWYIGRGYNQKDLIDTVGLVYDGEDAALVQARRGPVEVDARENLTPVAVQKPFWVTLEYLGSDGGQPGNAYVTLTPHRVLKAGESFFVDGAEYDVASIFTLVNPEGDGPEVKYITIRNPIPKEETVRINTISVEKEGWDKSTTGPGGNGANPAWLLPPFNHGGQHWYVDDIHIPEKTNGLDPDEQWLDNSASAETYIVDSYDTIAERLVKDYALEILWKDEAKEDRFDTNLMEEKFTEPEETWQWMNIESLPWHYTEFWLPERNDITDPTNLVNDDGDYILVSSLITEDSTEFWPGEGSVRMKFVYDKAQAGALGNEPADIYVNDNPIYPYGSSLRVYGRADENASFPYLTFDGPFNLDSIEAPAKDFVVHNPAFLDHWEDTLFQKIYADGDAYQKVHLRTWYVPDYEEPAGDTYPPVDPKVTTADIVNEYTYILLDDDEDNFLNPTHGSAGTTWFVFPMAGLGKQVGLDRYDINNDNTDTPVDDQGDGREYLSVDAIVPVEKDTTLGEMWVSAQPVSSDGMRLQTDESFDFFDYRVKLLDVSTDERKAEIAIYYIGNSWPELIGQATLQKGITADEKDTAITQARLGPIFVNTQDYVEQTWVEAVEYPFWVSLDYLGSANDYATLTPHRVLKAGETFFVDGAEYDVAAIYILDDPDGTGEDEFKYITIRNPIPKCEVANDADATAQSSPDPCKVEINDISVVKKAVMPFSNESIWVLPPFNMVHDRIDDVNIPDTVQGDPNGVVYPDEQYADNPATGVCKGCGDIIDRRVEDQDPLVMYWLPETKEERFDTNLLEEKFTELDQTPGSEAGEMWQWINIETMPWHYTELHLPDVDNTDCCATTACDEWGDYILVSSFMTEDSFEACVPARIETLTASKLVAQENEPIDFAATVSGDEPISTVWDFGGLATVEDALGGTFAFDEPGEYTVILEVTNECGGDVDSLKITVERCPGDFNDDDMRDTTDIGMMVPKWNSVAGDGVYEPQYDLNEDGKITLADIMAVVAVWMEPCPFTAD